MNADGIWIVLRIKARIPSGNCVIVLSQHSFHLRVDEDFPRSAPIKGKRKSITQVPEQSKDNGILNDEPSGKKLKVSKPSTSSSTNPALSTILEPFYFFENQD